MKVLKSSMENVADTYASRQHGLAWWELFKETTIDTKPHIFLHLKDFISVVMDAAGQLLPVAVFILFLYRWDSIVFRRHLRSLLSVISAFMSTKNWIKSLWPKYFEPETNCLHLNRLTFWALTSLTFCAGIKMATTGWQAELTMSLMLGG